MEDSKQKLTLLPTTSLNELLGKQFPPKRWLVDKLVPSNGITVLHGLPTAGKTWLMLEIAIAVSQGKPLFNEFETEKTGVLLLDEESGDWLLQDRFKTLRASFGLPIHMRSMTGEEFSENYMRKISIWCQENLVGVVMIDSFVRIHSGDENTAKDSAKIFKLIRMLTKDGLTVLLLHHNTKASANGEYGSQMRGSGDIQASVDCQLSLTRPHGDDYHVLEQVKNRYMRELAAIELSFIEREGHSEFIYIGQLDKKNKHAKLKHAVLQIIQDQQGINQSELHTQLNENGQQLHIKTLRSLLQKMENPEGSIRAESGKANTKHYFSSEDKR
jgi:RecA-family ATPase